MVLTPDPLPVGKHADLADLLLLRFSGGERLSGSSLAKELGVSRTAVWKAIERLRLRGCEINSSHGGYTLENQPDLINTSQASSELQTHFYRDILYFFETDSTNTVAKGLAEKGAPEGTVVVAEKQNAGKGRLGRAWASPRGGLWLSLILRPPIAPGEAAKLTLLAAMAVTRLLEEMEVDVQIKWPNDVLIDGKKVCGILGEMTAEMDRAGYVIIGIGLNVNLAINDLPQALRVQATSLKQETGYVHDRTELLIRLLQKFEVEYRSFLDRGSAPLLAAYRESNLLWGKTISVRTLKEVIEGTALGIDEEGDLIVEDAQGKKHILTAGDVTILR